MAQSNPTNSSLVLLLVLEKFGAMQTVGHSINKVLHLTPYELFQNSINKADDLEKAKFFIKKDIEEAWSGTYVQVGVTYTLKTDVSVEVKGDERAALESGLQNAIEVTVGPQGSHTDSYVRGHFSGPDTGKWNLGITGTSDNRGIFGGVASHEFTHILGVFDRFSGPDLSNTHISWGRRAEFKE